MNIINNTIDLVSKHDYIKIPKWFKYMRFKFKYTNLTIVRESENDHIPVLEWFYNSNYEFKYSNYAILIL